MDNDIVNQGTSNPDEELELDLTQDTNEVDVEKLRETNRKLFERAKKAEALAKTLKQQPQKSETVASISPSDILRSEEMKLFREGYNEDEIELIMRNGGRKILEDKANPIALGLQAKREQTRAEQEANKLSTSGGSEAIFQQYTPAQLASMSSAELEKILPHAD